MEQEETVDARPRADKTVFNVTLEGVDLKNKIRIIKEVKGITNMPLRQAKASVEAIETGTPIILLQNVSKEKATQTEKMFEGLGCQIKID